MGEYATRLSDKQNIKIGTCEDMLYLRADQVHLIEGQRGSFDPRDPKIAKALRFRFPFPNEDDVPPGAFDDPFLGMSLQEVEVPEGVEHTQVQFSNRRGLLVNLPCPESKECKESGLRVHYNGYSGKVRIVQQRLWGGHLALVCECGSCGAKYRLPTLEDARPILDVLADKSRDKSTREYYQLIADRIVAGYTAPNYWNP